MKKATQETASRQRYRAAVEAFYKTKDLSEAPGLYPCVMDAQPESVEAEYSRLQIQNIARAVVPKDELFDALVELTRLHVAQGKLPRVPSTPFAALTPFAGHVAISSYGTD